MAGRGDGSLYFDARKGLWTGSVDLGRDAHGRRVRKVVASRSKSAARTKLRAARERRDDQLPQLDDRQTVAAWLHHWAQHVVPRSVAAKTAQDYRWIVDAYLVPHVGRVRLSSLQPSHVERMMAALEAQGLAPRTVALARSVLRRALTIAERQHLVERNAAALTDPPRRTAPRIDDALTAEEAAAVLAAARSVPGPDGTTHTDRLYALAVLVLTVGLRQGAALALRWDDIDLDAATLTVRRSKTKSARMLPVALPDVTVAALREHRARQREERIASDVWGDPALVFTSTVGTVLDARNVLRWWHQLTIRAGVGRRRFHASRHTAATLMLNAGVPLEVVSATLGHASLAITADVYAKVGTKLQRTAATTMDQVLGAR